MTGLPRLKENVSSIFRGSKKLVQSPTSFLKETSIQFEFEKPLVSICFNHPLGVFSFIFYAVIASGVYVVGPALIAQILTYSTLVSITQLVLSLIMILLFLAFFKHIHPALTAKLPHYALLQAHEFILKCDPEFHTHADRKDISSHIDSLYREYKKLVSFIFMDLLPSLSSAILLVCLFSYYSIELGLAMICILIILWVMSLIAYRTTSFLDNPEVQKLKKETRRINAETLQQAPLIRATFSTQDYITLLRTYNLKSAHVNSLQNRMDTLSWCLVQSFGVIGLGVLIMITINVDVSRIDALALLSSYVYVTYRGTTIGKDIFNITSSRKKIIKSLHSIHSYGNQNFKVLPEDIVST